MATYLITGRTGAGKSTICQLLLNSGLTAFDGDKVPGLARWVDLKTLLPVIVDYTKPIDTTKFDWYWDEQVLRRLLQQHDAGDDIFLCGSAGNQLEFHALFTKVFVLTLSPEEQIRRIMSRERGFGKHPEMHAAILEDTAVFAAQALQKGGIAIDASPAPDRVVADILQRVEVADASR